MFLGMSDRVKPLVEQVRAIIRDEVMPLEHEYEMEIGKAGNRFSLTPRQIEILEGLKAKAKAKKMWNFWLTGSDQGYGLTTVEYAYLAEEMGWSKLAAETFNCSAPDTGNMEVFERYGTQAQKDAWLKPLLAGEIRSAYLMTEPQVASSDATNVSLSAKLDGDDWVLNGEKWWASGAGDPRCKIYITMVLTDPDAEKQIIARGLPASPGAAAGEIVFDPDDAETARAAGRDAILVRIETSPEDIQGMHAAKAIVTARGGMTSHAAVVARGMGRPCVCGAGSLQIDVERGVVRAGSRTLIPEPPPPKA